MYPLTANEAITALDGKFKPSGVPHPELPMPNKGVFSVWVFPGQRVSPFHPVETHLDYEFASGMKTGVMCTLHGADYLPPIFSTYERRTQESIEHELLFKFWRRMGAA